MNKEQKKSLESLVKAVNADNAEFDTFYTFEAHPFERGQYHVDISTDMTMFDTDLRRFVVWASDNNVLCWGSAYHSYLTLHLQ